ncbi:group II intron reverse transcriptase/maturase [Haliangium ochraceum]|uniref:RNA-directed DNA polymerase n=1 Tax=Haliangium ochraceum (strain DSM 14365 / JCM 11303 / SMP-2) TaxID=502025 RepID=D0LS09_HALO1|nr:group II intron reverse transcriptase/maturase [Haliangium ochraceum]ACY13706.1 RNA-directed DNA polymerase [Haliangium ochraceum DSM 14365]
MKETPSSEIISTRLEQIAKRAREMPEVALTTLAHHIDLVWLREAYRRTRKNAAPGIDGQTGRAYAEALESNLESLLERAKDGDRYRAMPVRRVAIPKGDGRMRPLGIPTFEDKVLQRAVVMVLEAVYEQDFLDCSYGYRRGRSAHDAVKAVRAHTMKLRGGWVLEADIEAFFDTVDHAKLREILRQRVRDGVLLRWIGKWLNAGVMEEGNVYYPEGGTPQGGVISPVLANIFLNEVIDQWFEHVVRPRLKGQGYLVRYADDLVMIFEREDDARRVETVLPKRLSKYGLRIHPEKTRLIQFLRPGYGTRPTRRDGNRPGTFDFLGFTHYWARSRKGSWVVMQKTAAKRLRRALGRFVEWCRDHRHDRLLAQREMLGKMLNGHYQYYGIIGNYRSLQRLYRMVQQVWYKWLSRRSRKARKSWVWMKALLTRLPLPRPRIVHSWYTPRVANP